MRHIDRDDPRQVESEIDDAVSQMDIELNRPMLSGNDLGAKLISHIEDVTHDAILKKHDCFFTWFATNPENARIELLGIIEHIKREWVIENLSEIQQRFCLGPYAERDAA